MNPPVKFAVLAPDLPPAWFADAAKAERIAARVTGARVAPCDAKGQVLGAGQGRRA